MADVDLDFLSQIPLFKRLSQPELKRVASAIRTQRVRSGALLFEQGEASDGAYIVKDGRLAVELPLPGGEVRNVARLGPGTVVGEVCLIEPAPRSLRVRALEETHLFFVDRARFNTLRASNDTGAYKMIRNIALTLSQRLRETNFKISEHWQGRKTETREETIRGIETKPKNAWAWLKTVFGGG